MLYRRLNIAASIHKMEAARLSISGLLLLLNLEGLLRLLHLFQWRQSSATCLRNSKLRMLGKEIGSGILLDDFLHHPVLTLADGAALPD